MIRPGGKPGVVLLAGMLLFASCASRPGEEPRPNVILIVVDSLRRDALGCYGAPAGSSDAIDALAAGGVRFSTCISQAPWTLPSTTTILSGLYPTSHGTTNIPSRIPSSVPLLAGRMKKLGYRTGAVVSHDLVGSGRGFERGFDFFDESNARGHTYVSSKSVTDIALDWIDRGGEPFFLFVHYFDPHFVWVEHEGLTPDAPYDGPLRPGMNIWKIRDEAETLGRDDIDYLRRLYAGEVRFTDKEIGRLAAHLEETGLDGATVILLTADHGEEFLEHGWLGHTRNLYQNLLAVPLIVRAPGRLEPAVREDAAMLVDVVPTILRLAGVKKSDMPQNLPGTALFDRVMGDRPLFSEVDYDPNDEEGGVPRMRRKMQKTAHLRSVIAGDWKAIENRAAGTAELYRLADDGAEMKDLAGREETTERLREMEARIARWEREIPRGEQEKIELSPVERKKLEALGYIR